MVLESISGHGDAMSKVPFRATKSTQHRFDELDRSYQCAGILLDVPLVVLGLLYKPMDREREGSRFIGRPETQQ